MEQYYVVPRQMTERLGTVTGLLTAREVAVLYGVTERTVLRWARAGRLPSFRLGERFRFAAEELPDERPERLGQ